MMSDNHTANSPLAKKLEELISLGLVNPMNMPTAQDFPSARVIMPVYDSTGVGPSVFRQGGTGGRLASDS